MNVIRINEFEAAENKTVELLAFLKSLLPYILSSEGCISCEILRNNDHKSSFVVIEKWTSIDLHKKSIELFPKDKMLAAMSLFGTPPKGRYYQAEI